MFATKKIGPLLRFGRYSWGVVLLLLFPFILAESSESKVQLKGFFLIGETPQFSIWDFQTNASKWARIGESAFGYTLTAFDPQKRVLKIRRGEEEFRLPLEHSRDSDSGRGGPDPTTEVTHYPISLSRKEGRVPFSSLSAEQQALYDDPAHVPALVRQNIQIPRRLLVRANSQLAQERIAREEASRSLRAPSWRHRPPASALRRGGSIPLVGNALTAEEKEARGNSL